jgi:SPP1 family predicted phage head-tail adaptor
MRGGDLRTLLTLEQPSETVVSGEATVVWTSMASVWAKYEGLGGTALGLSAEADARFTIRYRSDILRTWRIGLSGTARKFALVVPPQDRTGAKSEMVIFANEILA